MAKKQNFNFAKRQRELRKRKKAQEKLGARRARRSAGESKAEADSAAGVENGAKADVDEQAEDLARPQETPDS